MEPNDKRSRLTRVRDLLDSDLDRGLVYAALELRQLLEVLVYERLSAYSSYVPQRLTSKWQPAHALKMLLLFEPEANQEVSLRMAPEGPDGQPIGAWVNFGTAASIDVKWLTRRYNQLGSYVHAPHGSQSAPSPTKLRATLREILGEVEPLATAQLGGCSMGSRVTFECVKCDQKIMANAEHLSEGDLVECFSPDCAARHVAHEVEGGWQFELETVEFECESCHAPCRVERNLVVSGAVFQCECGAQYAVGMGLRQLASDGGCAT